jgi:hypothetical protein
MEDEDIVLINDGAVHTTSDATENVPDDREDSFRKIIKDSGTRVNVENLTSTFFSGDVEDRERLVRVLQKAQISPAKVETVYASWFNGDYPEDDGINLYKKPTKKEDSITDDDYDSEKLIKDMGNQELIAQKKRIMALQAKKLEIEMKKEIEDLSGKEYNTNTTERIEPVMTVDESGNIEVAKDEKGVPITRTIVQPMGSSSGSSMTELMMMQNMLGRGNSGESSGISEIKFQGLESEISRLKDKIENERERSNSERERFNDRIQDVKDKSVEDMTRLKDDNDRILNDIKDKLNNELNRVREDKDKEISVIIARNDDRVINMENRYADSISSLEDKYIAREERIADNMSRVESDAMDSINGIQARHHEELSRLHSDYKSQISHFVERADDNLSSAQTSFRSDLKHRDDMSSIKEMNDIRLKAIEQEMKDRENLTETERQNTQIINAVGSGVEKAIDTFGKPMAAGIVTQNTITQQTLEDQAINKKLALIDEMRRGGYSDTDVEFVTNKNAKAPQESHDAAYEKILEEDDQSMIVIDEHQRMSSQQVPIPQAPYGQPVARSNMSMKTSG